MLSRRCLDGVLKVSGSCLGGVWKLSGSCWDGIRKVPKIFCKPFLDLEGPHSSSPFGETKFGLDTVICV